MIGFCRCFARGDLIARSLAIFFGLFTVGNLLGELLVARFDATLWWIDLRFLPATASRIMLWVSAAAFLSFGFGPTTHRFSRGLTFLMATLLATIASSNAAHF